MCRYHHQYNHTHNTGAASTDLLGEICAPCGGWDLKAVFTGGQYQAVSKTSCLGDCHDFVVGCKHLLIVESTIFR